MGSQASSPEAEVETRGSSAGLSVTSESRLCARRLTNVDKKLMSDSVVCLWLLIVQSLDRCHWRLLSGRQILLARSAVSVMISLSLYLSLTPSLFLSLSLSLSPSLFLSLSFSLSFSPSLFLSLPLSLSPPLSLSIYLSRSPSLPRPLPVSLSFSLSLSLTHTHSFVPILCVLLSGTSVHLHGCAVTVFCSASFLMPLDTTQTLASTEEQRKKKRCVIIFAFYSVDRHN